MNKKHIAFLDEDQVLRLVWLALCDTAANAEQEIKDWFVPELVDPAAVTKLADGLHPRDGYEVHYGRNTSQSLKDASVVILRRGSVSSDLIASAPNLRLIQRLGARSESIDLVAAEAAGVAVSCLPRRTLVYTAEHVLLLMLSLAKGLLAADKVVRSGDYDPSLVKPVNDIAYNWPRLANIGGLYGHTLGIVGLGEVGALVVERAGAFGMTIIYSNRSRLPAAREQALGVSHRPLDALLAESDFVSLHASNIGPNDRLIGRAAFASMKRTAFFINTSRGRLVDEDALFDALAAGKIAGAGLDVHRLEPRPARDRFAALPTVVMTPHIAGGSRLGVLKEATAIFANMRAALAGEPPPYGRCLL
jgi:phosphoglycerate dehydrogenase-like enzyme